MNVGNSLQFKYKVRLKLTIKLGWNLQPEVVLFFLCTLKLPGGVVQSCVCSDFVSIRITAITQRWSYKRMVLAEGLICNGHNYQGKGFNRRFNNPLVQVVADV